MNPESQPHFSEMERQELVQFELWHKPFIVASICREDLRGILSDEQIAALDDSDMERIADKVSDSFRDSGGFWESLEILAQSMLAKREASETMNINEGKDDDLEPPSLETLQQWEAEGGCEAACPYSCWIEPDGVCTHGNESWLLRLGLI